MPTDSDLTVLDTPCLLIEQHVLADNIARMQALADQYGVDLRPHIKTHKMPVLAQTQIEAGACGIAVATLDEAETMAAVGIDDIQIARQVIGERNIARLVSLRRRARITCAVDNAENARALSAALARHGLTVGLLIEIDTGLRRCGLTDADDVLTLAQTIRDLPSVQFRGLMTHAGHAYGASSDHELAGIGRAEG
ncbi:alanine racemase, partial [candidate division GN15 bacterium]|nr:alanine racemase [candidate division GN15 bacterium]